MYYPEIDNHESFIVLFPQQRSELIKAYFLFNEQNLSPNRQIIKFHKFDDFFTPIYDIFIKDCSKLTTAITFPAFSNASSRTRTACYWENLVLVVVL